MISDLYKNIVPNADYETVWQGKCYLIEQFSAFFRGK